MITEALMQMMLNGYEFIMSKIPTLEINLPVDLVSGFINIAKGISYILPVADILLMLSIFIVITNFHIVINMIKFLRSLLPF